jgi:hypothetical protein
VLSDEVETLPLLNEIRKINDGIKKKIEIITETHYIDAI